jgi:predicted nucleic acid-binding protein
MYLLDTNVVSELRKIQAGKADCRVAAWEKTTDAETLFLSAVTVMELELGTLLMERKDSRQGTMLRSWLEKRVLSEFQDRILIVDYAVARRCAALHVPNPRPFRDSFIAATALVHGMTVVTRDASHFLGTGVEILNPWET